MYIYHENASAQASFTQTGDAYANNEKYQVAAVADSPLRHLVRSKLRQYPQDDCGQKAAQTFADTAVKELCRLKSMNAEINVEIFHEVLKNANLAVRHANEELGKKYSDPENYDITETVGMAAVVSGDKLIYGGLEDCYVNVLRGAELKNVAPLTYQIGKAGKYVEAETQAHIYDDKIPQIIKDNLKPEDWWEPMWCSYLRNNFDAKDAQGNLVGWGCFTGEDAAEKFFQIHEVELQPGDHIVVFSDGMIPLIDDIEFMQWFIENKRNDFDFGLEMRNKIIAKMGAEKHATHKEKTMVYWGF